MTTDKKIILRVKNLDAIARYLLNGQDYNITKLTIIKKICDSKEGFNRFALFISETAHGMEKHPEHKLLFEKSILAIQSFLDSPSQETSNHLMKTYHEVRDVQNEIQKIRGWPVRIIKCHNLIIAEYAMECVLTSSLEVSQNIAYQIASAYAEKYDPSSIGGLNQKSAPMVRAMADFWIGYYGL